MYPHLLPSTSVPNVMSCSLPQNGKWFTMEPDGGHVLFIMWTITHKTESNMKSEMSIKSCSVNVTFDWEKQSSVHRLRPFLFSVVFSPDHLSAGAEACVVPRTPSWLPPTLLKSELEHESSLDHCLLHCDSTVQPSELSFRKILWSVNKVLTCVIGCIPSAGIQLWAILQSVTLTQLYKETKPEHLLRLSLLAAETLTWNTLLETGTVQSPCNTNNTSKNPFCDSGNL